MPLYRVGSSGTQLRASEVGAARGPSPSVPTQPIERTGENIHHAGRRRSRRPLRGREPPNDHRPSVK